MRGERKCGKRKEAKTNWMLGAQTELREVAGIVFGELHRGRDIAALQARYRNSSSFKDNGALYIRVT